MTHARYRDDLEQVLRRLASRGGGELQMHKDHCAMEPCTCDPLLLWVPPHGREGWSVPAHLTGSHQRWTF